VGRRLLRYGGAAALTVAVVVGRLALNPYWGGAHDRHLVFLPTVMIVAYFGGLGPGLLSTVLSGIALARFWPDGVAQHPSQGTDLVLYFVACVAVCLLVDSLHRARAVAERASRSRERMLAVVAHDLRNPLSTVQLSLQLLRKRGDGAEPAGRRLLVMDRALHRMQGLIGDLVDLTQIEHGELTLHLGEVDAGEILGELAASHAPQAAERRISFAVEADPRLALRADRERLLQALGNLVGNALRYSPEGARIRLLAEAGDGHARFEVRDRGPGISEADLPHLFEPFWKGKDGGTGLGLYIAFEIVRAHGGRLSAVNEPEGGASFVLELPR
jgi:signal transduction histidine kinase